MSTYIEILRAHQRGKLKGPEPSQSDPTAAPPETPTTDEASEPLPSEEPQASPVDSETTGRNKPAEAPLDLESAENESPEGMLQEEAGAASSMSGADDGDRGDAALPEEIGDIPPELDDTDGAASGRMLPEEAGATSSGPDSTEADIDEALPEEQNGPSLDLDEASEAALTSMLQEEAGEAPLDFSDMDDALFAEMLPDEPETMPDTAEQPGSDQHGPDSLLADEAPEVDPPEAGAVAAETSVHTWLSGCVMLLVGLYEDAAHDTPTDTSPLSHHLDRFSAKIYEDPEELSALELDIANRIESIRESHADCGDLLQKAVMMMLYGFKICVQMRMEPAEITRYVAAAILHNIGMAQIFVDTRLKEGKLTNAERTLIRRVPEKSVDYLKRCGITDRVILLAAQQSHERHDGSGPHGLAGPDIALSARIVGLLSMFEALVHVRSYRKRLLPRDAIRELVNNYKNQFEPVILKNLIESVSLYPVGTYVQLNSGDIGQVVRIQPRLPLRPKVVLTMDRHGNRIQPREVDLHKQPNLMVQRCMYREGLVPIKSEEDDAEKQA